MGSDLRVLMIRETTGIWGKGLSLKGEWSNSNFIKEKYLNVLQKRVRD